MSGRTYLGFDTNTRIGASQATLEYVLVEPTVEFIPGTTTQRTLGGGSRYQGAPRCRWTYPDIQLRGEEFWQLQKLVGDNPSAAVVISIPTQDLDLTTYKPNYVTYEAQLHWPEMDGVRRVQYNRWEIDEIMFTNLVTP